MRVLPVIVVLSGVSCSSEEPAESSTLEEPDGLPDIPGVGGVLTGEGDLPVAGEDVLVCSLSWCLTVDSDDDGSFWTETEPDVALAVKSSERGEGRARMGTALEPCAVGSTDPVDIGALYQPSLPADLPWDPEGSGPQRFETAGGLTLTLERGDIALDVFGVFDDVASVALPAEHLEAYEIPGEDVLGVYTLHPFAAQSLSPVPVRAPSSLPAGTLVYFRSVDPLDGSLSAPAEGRSDGQYAETVEGDGLSLLTQVVLSIPNP